jgi:hypothetical protein
MNVSLTPGPSPGGEGNACPFSLREKVGMRERVPARGVPAGMGGKAAQSGEKGDEASLREFQFYVN